MRDIQPTSLHQRTPLYIGTKDLAEKVEAFIREWLKETNRQGLICVSVSEAGASVYSASDIAREEFPEHDVTVRGAVSIARRFQDPLAELVKVDPKSIGVGQYQHDVNQTALKKGLPAQVSVRGQISNFKAHGSSGHAYLTLKDQSLACIDSERWMGAKIVGSSVDHAHPTKIVPEGHLGIHVLILETGGSVRRPDRFPRESLSTPARLAHRLVRRGEPELRQVHPVVV